MRNKIKTNVTRKPKQRVYTYDISKYSKYYDKSAWRELRNKYIMQHPLCEECQKNGVTEAATDVHHKVPWSWGVTEADKMSLLLDPDNLQALCEHHHYLKHKHLNTIYKGRDISHQKKNF